MAAVQDGQRGKAGSDNALDLGWALCRASMVWYTGRGTPGLVGVLDRREVDINWGGTDQCLNCDEGCAKLHSLRSWIAASAESKADALGSRTYEVGTDGQVVQQIKDRQVDVNHNQLDIQKAAHDGRPAVWNHQLG